MSQTPIRNTYFTDTSVEILAFEQEIAYFYGVPHPNSVAKHYETALKQLEILGENASDQKLEASVLPFLVLAYEEVSKQTSLIFNIESAAKIELSLILAQAQKASFEEISTIMQNLYKTVFNSDVYAIHKAAMLRTFLYQYKITVLQNEKQISEDDKNLMLLLAKASEEALNSPK